MTMTPAAAATAAATTPAATGPARLNVGPADLELPGPLLGDTRRIAEVMALDALATTDPDAWAAIIGEELTEARGCDLEIRYCGCPTAHPRLLRLLSRSVLWDRLPGRLQAWVASDPCWLPVDLANQARERGCDRASEVCNCDPAHPRLCDLAHWLRLWYRLPSWARAWLVGDECWYAEARADEARENGCDPANEICVCPAERQGLFMLAVQLRVIGHLPRPVRRWGVRPLLAGGGAAALTFHRPPGRRGEATLPPAPAAPAPSTPTTSRRRRACTRSLPTSASPRAAPPRPTCRPGRPAAASLLARPSV